MELVIITGMSGAGKTTALHILEDLGYYCTDNIPPQLMPELAMALDASKTGRHDKIAMVADIRMGHFFSGIYSAIEKLKAMGCDCKLLFLEADNDSIINRYNFTKRRHPMSDNGTLLSGVTKERDMLAKIKEMSTYIIDTAGLSEKELKKRVKACFTGELQSTGRVHLVSFGFKWGMPADLDMMFDVRFLPNPFYDERLREHTGLEKPVAEYVFADSRNVKKARTIGDFLLSILNDYFVNAKESLTVGVGCTGGKHRSVATLEMCFEQLKAAGVNVTREHRDINL